MADGIGAGLIAREWSNQSGGSSRGGGNRGGGGWNRRSNDEDKSKLVCSYCKKKKHTKDQCFELIGYPDWWEEKHAKNSTALPPARTPWNGGGHAAAVVGGDGGGYPHAATEGNKEVTQTRGSDRGAALIGAAQPATHTGATNFAGGTVERGGIWRSWGRSGGG